MSFENRETTNGTRYTNGIHYSRFIASWCKACTQLSKPVYFGKNFEEWLRAIELSEDDIANIVLMAKCGKFELESRATYFMLAKMRKAG